MRGEERMLCLFYRESVPCHIMEKHLRLLAKEHVETKFVKMEAEKAPFLAERLKIWMLPTVAIIKNEKTTDYIVGLDEMGGVEDFETSVLETRLLQAGVIFDSSAVMNVNQQQTRSREVEVIRRGGCLRTASDEDSDFE